MIPSQMWKGILDGCVLKVISREETYGYEISEALKAFGFTEIAEGTIYPLLLRLERNGLIAATYRESPVGPRRKYFSITDAGLTELATFYNSWTQLASAIETLFEGGAQNASQSQSAQ
ncbi:MAG TPA: PadR family transcriptional regulator [Clostridiales bacterium]|jgi:PadR family transcriptional regulator PadR|nr:PadR family transcriptional regulator [Clostridiales bacterium]